MRFDLKEALDRAYKSYDLGRFQEAENRFNTLLRDHPEHPEVNYYLGLLAVNSKKFERAISFIKVALRKSSSTPKYWITYIEALIALEEFEEAASIVDRLEGKGSKGVKLKRLRDQIELKANRTQSDELKPQDQVEKVRRASRNNSHPKNNKYVKKGTNYLAEGRIDDAIKNLEKAVEIDPSNSAIHNNLGLALNESGDKKAAIRSFQDAINLDPKNSFAYVNLGRSLRSDGDIEGAKDCYEKAIGLDGDSSVSAVAYNDLGTLFMETNKSAALNYFLSALNSDGELSAAYENLGKVLAGANFSVAKPFVNEAVIKLLRQENLVSPRYIYSAIASILKLDPILSDVLRVTQSLGTVKDLRATILNLLNVPLLIESMKVCNTLGPDIEYLLTQIRSMLLSNLSELKTASEEISELVSALALHCYNNEYILDENEIEVDAVTKLEKNIHEKYSKGISPGAMEILVLASYRPLTRYPWLNDLVDTPTLNPVIQRQVEEPRVEREISISIPELKDITDEVSLAVREQYESNPYPRWVLTHRPKTPLNITECLAQANIRIRRNKISDCKSPEILIAGCGTGEQSVIAASRYRNSRVLAVDLSLRSLSYASRKSREIGIKNIEYMQADILELDRLKRQFDLIESTGVLHHMNNPVAGWEILTDCLKPGGFLKVALYSELARRDIVRIRKEIEVQKISSDPLAMKSFRASIIDSDEEHHKRIQLLADFYSLSELRDLLFHVQEHRFTIPQIETNLGKLGMTFCGFETGFANLEAEQVITAENPEPDDLFDLKKWQEFESKNPETFIGMYQFWCQKL